MGRIQDCFNVLSFEPFADPEGLAEEVNVAVSGDHANKGDSARGDGQQLGWNDKRCGE